MLSLWPLRIQRLILFFITPSLLKVMVAGNPSIPGFCCHQRGRLLLQAEIFAFFIKKILTVKFDYISLFPFLTPDSLPMLLQIHSLLFFLINCY